MKIHKCPELIQETENHNTVNGSKTVDFAGGECAINKIYYSEREKCWFGTNDEYGITIYYCPFCGTKLE